MKSDVLKRYAQIKQELTSLEEERKAIELEVIDLVDDEGGSLSTVFGNFTLGSRRTYKYSPKIEGMQKKVYEAKKKEEADGTAELVKHSQHIVFTTNK